MTMREGDLEDVFGKERAECQGCEGVSKDDDESQVLRLLDDKG